MFLGNDHIKNVIERMFSTQRFDNIIIQGEESMGKTSFINYLLKEKLTENKYPYLYLHFLEDKGIDMIRNKIKYFTELKHDKMKFILIDDADDLSTSAQQSLRRIMEEKKKTSTFIFTVSNFKHLIFPIHSRCLLFQLRQLTKEQKLEYMYAKYNKKYSKHFIRKVSSLYDYNIYTINQNIAKYKKNTNLKKKIIALKNKSNIQIEDIQHLVKFLEEYDLTSINIKIEESIEILKQYTKNKDPQLYHYYYNIKPSLFNIIKPFVT